MTQRQTTTATIDSERVRLRSQRDNELVTATVRENFFAGIGGGVIVLSGGVGWCAWSGQPLNEYHFVAAAVAAGFVFGVLSLVRFSLDEVQEVWQKMAREKMLVDFAIEIEDLRAKLQNANATIREQTQQIAVLSTGGNPKVVSNVDNFSILLQQARMIIERWAANLAYSRQELRDSMTDKEWNDAMNLIERSGCAGRGGIGGRQRVITGKDYPTVMSAVEGRTMLEREDRRNNFTRV